jgi:hypothetical protein
MNGTAAATMATYVLFAQEILLLDGLGFGLLLASGSVGGVAGSLLAANVDRSPAVGPVAADHDRGADLRVRGHGRDLQRLRGRRVVRGLHLHRVLWNVVTVSLRQTMIPDDILGRVNSVYRFLGWGAMPIGTLLGGAIVTWGETLFTREIGLRAPFVLAAGVHLLLLLTVAPRLRTRTIEAARDAAPAG